MVKRRMNNRRRKGGKRRINKRKSTSRRGGYLKIIRACPPIAFTNNGSAGGVQLVDSGTGTMVQFTTPTLSVGSAANYDIPFSMRFRLDQLASYGDLTTLADSYKIAKVLVRFFYTKNESSPAFQGGMPYLEYYQDNDDAVPPTIVSMPQIMGSKIKAFNGQFINMSLVPKVRNTVQATVGATAYAVQSSKSQFINSAYSDVEHYAVKGIIRNFYLPNTNPNYEVLKMEVKFLVHAKDFQ